MAVPPATALHMGYPCMIPACQHYPAMLLPLALSHLESSACISAEGSVSHPVCGSQTVSLQKERKEAIKVLCCFVFKSKCQGQAQVPPGLSHRCIMH